MVLDHQRDRALIQPELPGRYPATGIVGSIRVGFVKRGLKATVILVLQFAMINEIVQRW